MSKLNSLRKFPQTFWVANTMELFERLAWYGLYMVLALYLTNSTDIGGLGFSQEEKGQIMGIGSAVLYFLPVITGAIADKLGYRLVLFVSYIIYASGYIMLSYVSSYWGVFGVFMYIVLGGALFKPIISATVTKTTNSTNASMGFGIFYMIVNVGAFIAPLIVSKLRGIDWNYVFYMAAAAIFVNMLLLFFLYKEPKREKTENTLQQSIKEAFTNIITALKDVKLAVFLVIMVGFWTVYNQLFYTLPVYIEQWVDTKLLYNFLHDISPALASALGTKYGTIAPEILTNIDAGFIILFQVLVSGYVMRFRPVNTIIVGFIILTIGLSLALIASNPFFVVIAIMVFSFGEMTSSPKFTEYVGRIAPKGKEALYIGTSFLPLAGGHYIAGWLSGDIYGSISDKFTLTQTECAKQGIELMPISDSYTKSQLMTDAMTQLGMTSDELTNFLWVNYSPSNIWLVFSGIGGATVLALFLYNKFMLKSVPTQK